MVNCNSTGATFNHEAVILVLIISPSPSCLPPGPLKVVVPTESVSSYLGDTALLHCEVSGDPTPVIRWQKNREDLPLTFDPDSRLATLPSGSLQVSRVQPPDSATYRCLSDNPGSTRTGTDAELRVLPGTGRLCAVIHLRSACFQSISHKVYLPERPTEP